MTIGVFFGEENNLLTPFIFNAEITLGKQRHAFKTW